MSTKRLAYANTENTIINAIINGLYSFREKKDALEVLNGLRYKFILSKHSPKEDTESMILWIKGFEVLETEEYFSGNFAQVTVEEKEGEKGKWTIKAHKIPTELKHHPQRVYQRQQHPNWGHPVLRGVKKRRRYETVELAAKEMQTLQEEYPKTSIPGPNKLFLMIYEKGEAGGQVTKYTLEIKAGEVEGDTPPYFYIDHYLNEKAGKAKPAAPTEGQAPQGRFTTMVALGRNKKKRAVPPAGGAAAANEGASEAASGDSTE